MHAGYSAQTINPPPGTRMAGFGGRDKEKGVEGIHDPLEVRCLYTRHGREEALILGYDLLFFSRENADRLKGALGRALDLRPRQILLNTSHTHVGASVGLWGYEREWRPDWAYLADVERASVTAALTAKRGARPVTVTAGATRSRLPVSRRRPDGKGGVEWRPYPAGEVCPHLPFALFSDRRGRPVCLLFSVSCHPSTVSGFQASADYPGVACRTLDRQLGAACSLFLQGAGGDTKACTIADGVDATGLPCWRSGPWERVQEAGELVAREVSAGLAAMDRTPLRPDVRTAITEMHWPLLPPPTRAALAAAAADQYEIRRLWARDLLAALDQGRTLPTTADILAQGIKLADGLRLVAIEGELVGDLGRAILAEYASGVTVPLGYSNGTGLYLPSTRMCAEHGYEVDSFGEYGYPSQLAPGMDDRLAATVQELQAAGVK